MGTVVEEAQRTATRRSVVDDFGHHRAFLVEEQLVTNTDLSRRLHKHVPQTQFWVQLAQQEYLDAGIGLLLRAVEAGREHLRIVEDERVALVKVVQNVAKHERLVGRLALGVLFRQLNSLALAVDNHQTTLVTTIDTLYGTIL